MIQIPFQFLSGEQGDVNLSTVVGIRANYSTTLKRVKKKKRKRKTLWKYCPKKFIAQTTSNKWKLKATFIALAASNAIISTMLGNIGVAFYNISTSAYA